MKIIQIDGIKGLITVAFMGVCLFAGFVVFPGIVAMHFWNKYLVTLYMFPALNVFQGVLLWGICAISYLILSKDGFAVSFRNTPELSDKDLDMIMRKAKIQSQVERVNKMIQKADCFEKSKKTVITPENNLAHTSSPLNTENASSADSNSNNEENLSKVK